MVEKLKEWCSWLTTSLPYVQASAENIAGAVSIADKDLVRLLQFHYLFLFWYLFSPIQLPFKRDEGSAMLLTSQVVIIARFCWKP